MKSKAIILLLAIWFGWSIFRGTAQVPDSVILPPAQKTGGMSLMEALQNRQSQRSFSSKELSLQQLSDLLWAADGINRPNGFRTAPSAKGYNELDIYIIKPEGWFVYEPVKHIMVKMGNEDLREYAGTQDFAKTAPVNLVFVADFDRMTNTDEEFKKFYSAADVGYISQNVYLFCAATGLATVVRGGIDKVSAGEALRLRPNQHIILAQTVGYPADHTAALDW